MTYKSDQAEDSFVGGPDGERFHYRRFGRAGGVPLVLCMRLRGTVDHWDPQLLDALATEREVIVFDNRGTSLSSGDAPTTIDGLADGAIAFIRALGLTRVDVLGWSLGGIVAQGIALRAPELVRCLVVAGSTPAGVPDQRHQDHASGKSSATLSTTMKTICICSFRRRIRAVLPAWRPCGAWILGWRGPRRRCRARRTGRSWVPSPRSAAITHAWPS